MKNLTEIVCVLDRSGSMASIVDDAIGGFNTFLKSQQETPGEAIMSVVLFDNEYEMLYSGKPLSSIPPFNRDTFVPRGSTALYDAIGRTIHDVGVRLASLQESERPNKVLFVILTDGQENASQKYSSAQIQQMITEQRNVYSWEFIFLAANQDAFAVSESMGISKGNALNFAATPAGTQVMYEKMSKATSKYRSANFDKAMRDRLLDDFTDEAKNSDKPFK
ncbi:vWA domain-containing protein [Rhodocytophaga rosea]|uniref:vWA domain-containing protein n=1 Tax=Rhodocytophaga rosea TaxID=2704465 RepID=UPI0018D84479|nr:vWA domain-containing protein [Rhodocytophaga rosea]